MMASTSIRPTRRARLLAATLIGLLVAMLVLAVALRVIYSGKVLPGVRVAGTGFGGTSEADLRSRLAPVASRTRPVTVVAQGRRIAVRPEAAGYSPNLQETAARALDSGREGPLAGMWSTVSGLIEARDVPVAVNSDRRALAAAVDATADRIDRAAFAGALVVDPASLAVSTNPPRSGREVDRRLLASRLRPALERRAGGTVQAPLRATIVAQPADVESVGRAARALLRSPLRLIDPGRAALEIMPAELAPLLILESREGGRRVRLGAREGPLAALVERLATKRDRPARNARVNAPARAATFDDKDSAGWRPRPASVSVRAGSPGRLVQRSALQREIRAAITAGRHRARLMAKDVNPAVSAKSARAIDSLIGTFTTFYVPGQPRVTNIRRIAATVDGTVVAAGARFSLNAAAGPRTVEKGYVKAPFIADGMIVPSVGGGVSQFSTTLYNAVYFGGLQIDGHRPHSFYIDRYPAGREATLNFPDIDLAWTNDTSAPVLIRASTDGNSVAVSLYGSNGGRRVRSELDERVPSSDGGAFSITVTRVIRYSSDKVVRQPFTTRYDQPPPPE